MGQYIYIELNIFAATVTVVLLFVLGKKKESFPAGELFAAVLSAVLAILVCDIVYWLVDGKTFFGARKINCAVNFLYFLLQNIACSLFGLFCFKATGRKITAGFSAMYFILAAFSVALSVASLVSNGLLYTVTPDNVYM